MDLFNEQDNGAVFSEDRKYRYALWRIWNRELPIAMFVGLNPSTANETEPDATIKSVSRIVSGWGYGGFYMMNLFAIVSKKPEVLLTDPDPLGENDGWLEKIAPKCQKIVFAWGAFKQAKERAAKVVEMFPDAECLEILKDGSPRHPLYIEATRQPIKYK